MIEVLFVCTGNTCRSPMAEAIARDVYSGRRADVQFASRGVNVLMPACATAYAVQTVQAEYGLDLSNHMAQPLSEADMKRADLILTMTGAHEEYLLYAYPAYACKVFALCAYAGIEGKEIKDPYGLDAAAYKACAKEIRACIEGLALPAAHAE